MLYLTKSNWEKYFKKVLTFESVHYIAQRRGIKLNRVHSDKYMCFVNAYTLENVIKVLEIKS